MIALLDTDVCVALLRGTSTTLADRIARCSPSDLAISAVTSAELIYGAHKSARPATNLRLVERFLAPITALPFDGEAATHYGRVRADLARRGEMIGPNDLLIAATALSHDLPVITCNVREFGRVVGLHVENWETH